HAVHQPARRAAEPRGRLEDSLCVWQASGHAQGFDAAHAAAQFCNAFAGTRRGFALRPVDAGPFGHLHDANLYPRRGGKTETDLQGTSPARLTRGRQYIAGAAALWGMTTLKRKERNARLHFFAGKPALARTARGHAARAGVGRGHGFNIYLTGGTVRDLITGATLRDLDFSVEGNPSKMARELEKGGAKVISEDEKLRTVEILFSGDYEGSISA